MKVLTRKDRQYCKACKERIKFILQVLSTDINRCGPQSYREKVEYEYGKCSKFSNTSCLPKRPKQTVQTKIRLLPNKKSDLCAILTSIL